MKAENFMQVLGELDGRYVEEALGYRRKARKPAWAVWAAVACLCIAAGAAAMPRLLDRGGDSRIEDPAAGDVCPMVYVNGKIYQMPHEQPDFDEIKEQLVYIGEIQSAVSSSQEPEENFQANDEIVGAQVYRYGDDIAVCFEGNYFLYENRERLRQEGAEGIRQNGKTGK